MIDYRIIAELLMSGCKWQYESYDYKKAIAEFRLTDEGIEYFSQPFFDYMYNMDGERIPKKIRLNHSVLRNGKVREIKFDNSSKIWKVYIGNKYSKVFFIPDFGVTVKPMLLKSEDKHGLIELGLAVEETNF